jgi:hypothetical protein
MKTRKSPPATKHDLRLFEQRLIGRLDNKLDERDARLTKHFDARINQAIRESQEIILRHFDLTVETIRHDLLGANADAIASLTDRVDRLERQIGLAA